MCYVCVVCMVIRTMLPIYHVPYIVPLHYMGIVPLYSGYIPYARIRRLAKERKESDLGHSPNLYQETLLRIRRKSSPHIDLY